MSTLYYCGFSDHLKFSDDRCDRNDHFKPLDSLQINAKYGRIVRIFIGWCSMFLITDKHALLYISYSNSQMHRMSIVLCNFEPIVEIAHIECGTKQTFLLTTDATIKKWPTFHFIDPPVEVDDFLQAHDQVEQICVGSTFVCALLKDGIVKGMDEDGSNVTFSCEETFASVACGHEHILLLSKKGRVYSYGKGSKGQLGHSLVEDVFEDAKLIEALDGIEIVQIAVGGWHSMALSSIGDIYVWGWNESGQLGLKKDEVNVKATPTPLEIDGELSFSQISCGSRHSMAVTNGKLYGWGWNKWGQLGLDAKENPICDYPIRIPCKIDVKCVECKYWSTIIQ